MCIRDSDGGVWRTGGAHQGFRDCAIHLHAVLDRAMRILGISAFYHDSAAALIDDGRVIAAAQEERFTRRKHDAAFPHNAIAYCLAEAGITAGNLDHVVFYDKPFLKFERLLETYIALAPRGFRSFKMSIPLWLREKLFQKSLLRDELKKFGDHFDVGRLLFCEHHLSHAASAFYPSPYGRRLRRRWVQVRTWRCSRRSTSHIHSVCCIRHSLITLVSRLTPASTR